MSDQTVQDVADPERQGGTMTPHELVALSVVARTQSHITREHSEAIRSRTHVEIERLVHQVETLTQALETRTQIATAVGILMGRQNLSNEEAFAILRRASQRTNRKLRDIAIEMLDSHNQRLGSSVEPRATA